MFGVSFQIIFSLLVSFTGAIFDWKLRKVPNWLTFGTFFLVLIYSFLSLDSHRILNCITGFLTGIVLLIIPYLAGGMGAGDVKLLGAIGSIVGFHAVLFIFFYSAFCGLCIGILWLAFHPGRLKFLLTTGKILPAVDRKEKIPYAVAIFLGVLLYALIGNRFL